MGLRRASHVAWRRVGDETVLIHLRNKRIYVLNPSGGFVWHGLDGARGVTQLLEGFECPLPEDAPGRVDSFLRQLQDSDLVDAEGAPGAASTPLPDFPLAAFVSPELVWQQELRNFGQSCAFMSGSSPACDAVPTT